MKNDDDEVGRHQPRRVVRQSDAHALEIAEQDESEGGLQHEQDKAFPEDASSMDSSQVLFHLQEINDIFLILLIICQGQRFMLQCSLYRGALQQCLVQLAHR